MKTVSGDGRRLRGGVGTVGLILCGLLAALVLGGGSATGQEASAAPKPLNEVGAFGASPADAAAEQQFANQTIRMISYMHSGGDEITVRLSNEFGTLPVTFDSVYVGLQGRSMSGAATDTPTVDEGTNRRVTFGGKGTVTIQPGEDVESDPVKQLVRPLESVVTSLFTSGATGPATQHPESGQASFVAAGDLTSSDAGAGFAPLPPAEVNIIPTGTEGPYYFLTDVEARKSAKAGTIVTLGDSITDGTNSTANQNRRYPDYLARRLLDDERYEHLSVSNQAISGNQVLDDSPALSQAGPSALSRLDGDVLSQPCLSGVVLLEGINDIGRGGGTDTDTPTAEEIIAGYREIIDRVHARGVPIFGGTLLPSGDLGEPAPYGPDYSGPDDNAKRNEVNDFVRNSGEFDGVIDFDAALRDPSFPERMRDEFDSGDHLHPNDAGYEAMAAAVPLSLFDNTASCEPRGTEPQPQPQPQPQPAPQPRPNAAPDARNDSFTTREDRTLTVRRPGVLRNDRDVNGDRLSARVVNRPRHGRLTLRADGSFVYRPDRNYNGRDSFVYSVSDARGGTDRARVTLRVRPVPEPNRPSGGGGTSTSTSSQSSSQSSDNGGNSDIAGEGRDGR